MSHDLLPLSPSPAEYDVLREDPKRWLGAVRTLALQHGLSGEISAIATGTNCLAFVGGELVAKLYPPFLEHQWLSECAALEYLDGRLRVAIPRLVFQGSASGWPYVIMTRLNGVPLQDVWDGLEESGRLGLLNEIGAVIAAVQSVPVGPLAALEPEWNAFLAHQRGRCAARHAACGMPPRLVRDVERWLASTDALDRRRSMPVILTGEYTPENLLVERTGEGWRITGLIDFGDVMTGAPLYDLVGPGVFLCAGDARRLAALLDGFGLDAPERTPELRALLMRMLLLHRYSDLDIQVRLERWRESPDLDSLARRLWPVEGG